ncbi:tRNA (carboxymethyluridine(34)-5-O)-methyltransferase [Erysiphe necator]|uniref:Putative trna (Uracil-5-)-methyltransferase trm9 n=1 Tax=Uncinula necator TaxID=52586 RepID=A0A0B1P1X8_UNCNE|nr:tRNA (carboxymethyluridine(34)-5-O)-methyltransferase [Erysiphe necator]KHJ32268.1 putative trna (uracil-5-)-methyltransferase trm9 [Erysiphe necator]
MGLPEETELLAEKYEEKHVHEVYEQIANHFSATRYKPWPIVEKFLQNLSPGSIGIDVGCGNGKYLSINNNNIFIMGNDRSKNLIQIAKKKIYTSNTIMIADSLYLPYQNERLDFAISIAVIHHLSTRQRRRDAIKNIISCLHQDGQALIFVWALEQKGSRRGWHEGGEQDITVPWVMKSNWVKTDENGTKDETFLRYYHLYKEGELEEDIISVNGKVLDYGYERDNWWAICQRSNM